MNEADVAALARAADPDGVMFTRALALWLAVKHIDGDNYISDRVVGVAKKFEQYLKGE